MHVYIRVPTLQPQYMHESSLIIGSHFSCFLLMELHPPPLHTVQLLELRLMIHA